MLGKDELTMVEVKEWSEAYYRQSAHKWHLARFYGEWQAPRPHLHIMQSVVDLLVPMETKLYS